MQGSLTEISLVDLIQINCLERKRSRLRLWFEHSEAVLFFDEGEVVHARTGVLEGREALFDVLAWPGGTFEMVSGVAPPVRSLDDTWSGLLLEGMRQIDEGNRHRGEAGHAGRSQPPASATNGGNGARPERSAAPHGDGRDQADDLAHRLQSILSGS